MKRKFSYVARAAFACLGALTAAGLAVAQPSSVTLYGRVDLNITKFNNGGAWEMSQSSNSRIGLRGSEDLGGNLRAIFNLESRINADTGTTEAKFWGRESWLGLRGGFGTLRFGRTLTPSQRVASNYDPHGTDGIGSFGSGGLLIGHALLARFDDGIYYETPSWGGFTVFTSVQLDDQVNATDERYYSTRLRFARGPVDIALAQAELSPGNDVTSLGLALRLGGLTPMLQYHSGERAGRKRATYLVGLLATLGAGELRVAHSKSDDRFTTNIDRTLSALGYDYLLSKRTILYGTIARDETTNQRARTGFEAGVRHLF